MTTITPYAGARYQKGHGLANIFRTLFRTAIPLLKGPAVRAGIGLAGDVIRGKSMTQALKNRVAPLLQPRNRQDVVFHRENYSSTSQPPAQLN